METPIITSVTYNELVALINSNSLEPGLQYEINDYRTRHYIVDYDHIRFYGPGNENIGYLEPLIVTATASNQIDKEAKSSLFPLDIIHYDWNPNNWLTDPSFADAEATASIIISGFTGVILFRHDLLYDNYISYDWRSVKFRRWKTQTDPWNNSITYNKGDIVNYNNMIYKSTSVNTNIVPVLNSNTWHELLNLSRFEYWNASSTIMNGIPSSTEYADFLTLVDSQSGKTYENSCRSNHFGKFNDVNDFGTGRTLLPNNVVFLDDSIVFGYSLCSNTCESDFAYNTIVAPFNYNAAATNFYGNMINTNFNSNKIDNFFSDNIVRTSFNFNRVGNYSISNVFGNNCSFNDFSPRTSMNMIGNSAIHNNIGTHFSNNVTGYIFSHNTTSAEFVNNVLGDNFSLNHIANKCSGNTIGTGFDSNLIGTDFSLNVIGNYFNNNSVSNKFTNNGIANNFYYNTIGNDFSFNTNIQNNFRYNFGSCDHLNFLSATHVYHDHTTNFFKNELGYMKLNYIDAINTPIVVDANS